MNFGSVIRVCRRWFYRTLSSIPTLFYFSKEFAPRPLSCFDQGSFFERNGRD